MKINAAGMVKMDRMLTAHRLLVALPAEVADDLIQTCSTVFRTQYGLWEHFNKEKIPLFGITSKAHSLEHICLQSRQRGAHV